MRLAYAHEYTRLQAARQSPEVTRWIGRGTVTNESMHVDGRLAVIRPNPSLILGHWQQPAGRSFVLFTSARRHDYDESEIRDSFHRSIA